MKATYKIPELNKMRSVKDLSLLSHNQWQNPMVKNMYVDSFRKNNPFEVRYKEANRIKEKYPSRIPVICQRSHNSELDTISKTKYLVPKDLTATQFLFIIRKRLKLPSEKGVFLFVNNIIASSNSTMMDLYESCRDPDGFLYAFYTEENVFG